MPEQALGAILLDLGMVVKIIYKMYAKKSLGFSVKITYCLSLENQHHDNMSIIIQLMIITF